MTRTPRLLIAVAVTLGLSSVVVATQSTLAGGSAQKQPQTVVGHAGLTPMAQAIPVSMHMPDPAMLPLLGAGALLMLRRRRT